jgi:hypothetical protein
VKHTTRTLSGECCYMKGCSTQRAHTLRTCELVPVSHQSVSSRPPRAHHTVSGDGSELVPSRDHTLRLTAVSHRAEANMNDLPRIPTRSLTTKPLFPKGKSGEDQNTPIARGGFADACHRPAPRVEGVAPLRGFSVAGLQYRTVLRTHNRVS